MLIGLEPNISFAGHRTSGTKPLPRKRGSSPHDSPCDIDQTMDSSDVSQTGSVLLSRRLQQSRHKISSERAHHRAPTTPHNKVGRLGSSSTTSSLTMESGEGKRLSTGTYSCHISCRVSPNMPGHFEYLQPYSVFRSPLKRSKSVPNSFSDSYCLQHPDLNEGQKTYLWHTAAVYSMSNMKALQERRYKELLQHQVDIGFHTQEKCDQYLSYLRGSRKRQYIADPRVWREPPKIPVRQKLFHHPSPVKSQSPPDYRFFPGGYEGSTKDVSEDKSNAEDNEKHENQAKDKGHTKGNGQTANMNQGRGEGQSEERPKNKENSYTFKTGHLNGTEKAIDENKKDNEHCEGQDLHLVSDCEQSLSEFMQEVSLFYDRKRKTTVTRGQKENQEGSRRTCTVGEESQNTQQISHQNCFWGSH